MNNYGASNAIINLPIPIVIGNTSFESQSKDEYFYLSGYLVDEPYNANYNNFVYYDNFCKNWVLACRPLASKNLWQYIFPILSSYSSQGIGQNHINPFVNFNGYPIIESNEYFYFSENLNKWCYGPLMDSVKFENENYNFPIYDDCCKDLAEIKLGDLNENYSISGFEEDTPLINSYAKLIPISAGNMNSYDQLITFSNNESSISAKFCYINSTYEHNYFKRDDSPQIISGSPCLGYYGPSSLTNPYVIGSICIGTEDLTTVPPMIGTIKRTHVQSMRYPIAFNEERHYKQLKNDYHNNGYWWIATTFDENQTRWDLYEIINGFIPESGSARPFNAGNIILISGGVDRPDTAKQFWYRTRSSSSIPFISYNTFKTNTLRFTGYPSSPNLELKIVGLTDFNAELIKYGISTYTNGAIDTYIGNWIAPIAEFDNGENTNA